VAAANMRTGIVQKARGVYLGRAECCLVEKSAIVLSPGSSARATTSSGSRTLYNNHGYTHSLDDKVALETARTNTTRPISRQDLRRLSSRPIYRTLLRNDVSTCTPIRS
jgi:hypothetical protein